VPSKQDVAGSSSVPRSKRQLSRERLRHLPRPAFVNRAGCL
jgi:hypothetical protein